MDKQSEHLKDEQFDIDKKIEENGRLVNEMLKTQGWTEIIGPLLDKMIQDVLGAKVNGRWTCGASNVNTMDPNEANCFIWYRQALIEFHNYVNSYIDMSKEIERQRHEKGGHGDKPSVPMMSGPYHHEDMNFQKSAYSSHDSEGISG
jgi:hypothetical protein